MKPLLLLTSILFMINPQIKTKDPAYKNPNLPIDERVADLLSRMTLEEKAAQMIAADKEVKDSIFIMEDGEIAFGNIKEAFPHGIGQVTRVSETRGGQSQTSRQDAKPLSPYENTVLANKLQKYFIENTRLGIPVIFHEECLHGLVASQATSFPHPIAIAGTFNDALVGEVYTMIAKETRLRGGHQALTPVVDIARDARWGRVEETYGEDPYLTSRIGIAAVKGFQGEGPEIDKEHIAATLKHFAAHGQPEGGTNTAPANYSERILREIHFFPFREIIQKAGVKSVMTTYHEIDGVPINANKWLVTDLLRNEWGFEGFVVSDYFSIREMHERWGINTHRVAADGKHAAELALKAGVNIELPNPDCYLNIIELVEEGIISEASIDKLVAELLRVKFELGLFDNPYTEPEEARAFCASEKNRGLAKEAALQSIVLLQNKYEAVPLNLDDIKHIAVIGPNANRENIGGYSGPPYHYSTLLEGIKDKVGNRAKVSYAEGCRITIGGSWVEDKVNFPDEEEEQDRIAEAVNLAKDADVIVLGIGGNEQTSRESWNNYHMGDRASLDLVGMQDELIDALTKTGKPIIAFLFNGRPLSINNLIDKADVIFECWYPGQEAGHACAEILFGEYNPGAKLAISFPRSAGHIPVYYNHKPSARRGYFNDDVTPLYPFGYGLSYTTFEMSKLRLEKDVISPDESLKVLVDIRNTGTVKGDEVIQLYIRDELSTVTRPVKELKDFARITLEPGQMKTVELTITPEKLKFYDINMDYRVEPGVFTVMVGSSSADKDLITIQLEVRE
ncbi:glycoside hydrolase family 3 N-terminal domain-containing protein [Bacteroidota bacterium]